MNKLLPLILLIGCGELRSTPKELQFQAENAYLTGLLSFIMDEVNPLLGCQALTFNDYKFIENTNRNIVYVIQDSELIKQVNDEYPENGNAIAFYNHADRRIVMQDRDFDNLNSHPLKNKEERINNIKSIDTLTLIHEIGHAMRLKHTEYKSVMSSSPAMPLAKAFHSLVDELNKNNLNPCEHNNE